MKLFPPDMAHDASQQIEGDLPDDVRVITIGAQCQYQAKVDAIDYAVLIENRWTFKRSSWKWDGNIYARRCINRGGRKITLLMHRFILETCMGVAPPSDLHTGDHINGDTLDNRRGNLRWATPSQQSRNQKGRAR